MGSILNAIGRMTSLTTLDLEHLPGWLHRDRDLLALQNLTRLGTLKCNRNVHTAFRRLIPRFALLRELHLGAAKAARGLHSLNQLQHLVELTVHAPDFLLELMKVVATLRPLRKLRLMYPAHHSPVEPAHAYMELRDSRYGQRPPFPVASQVSDVSISSTHFGPSVMQNLARALPGLVKMELRQCLYFAADLPHLQSIPGLEELRLCGCRLPPRAADDDLYAPGLKGFPALRKLTATGKGIRALIQDISLLVPPTLAELTLASGDEGPLEEALLVDADDFLQAIRAAPGVATLSLTGVIRLIPRSDDSEGEEAATPHAHAASDLRVALFKALPRLEKVSIAELSWTR